MEENVGCSSDHVNQTYYNFGDFNSPITLSRLAVPGCEVLMFQISSSTPYLCIASEAIIKTCGTCFSAVFLCYCSLNLTLVMFQIEGIRSSNSSF